MPIVTTKNRWGTRGGLEIQRSDMWVALFDLRDLNETTPDTIANVHDGIMYQFCHSASFSESVINPMEVKRFSLPLQLPGYDQAYQGVRFTFNIGKDAESLGGLPPVVSVLKQWYNAARAGRGGIDYRYLLTKDGTENVVPESSYINLVEGQGIPNFTKNIALVLLRGSERSVLAKNPQAEVNNDLNLQASWVFLLKRAWCGGLQMDELSYDGSNASRIIAQVYPEVVDWLPAFDLVKNRFLPEAGNKPLGDTVSDLSLASIIEGVKARIEDQRSAAANELTGGVGLNSLTQQDGVFFQNPDAELDVRVTADGYATSEQLDEAIENDVVSTGSVQTRRITYRGEVIEVPVDLNGEDDASALRVANGQILSKVADLEADYQIEQYRQANPEDPEGFGFLQVPGTGDAVPYGFEGSPSYEDALTDVYNKSTELQERASENYNAALGSQNTTEVVGGEEVLSFGTVASEANKQSIKFNNREYEYTPQPGETQEEAEANAKVHFKEVITKDQFPA